MNHQQDNHTLDETRTAAGDAASFLEVVRNDLVGTSTFVHHLEWDRVVMLATVLAATLRETVEGNVKFHDVDDVVYWLRSLSDPEHEVA